MAREDGQQRGDALHAHRCAVLGLLAAEGWSWALPFGWPATYRLAGMALCPGFVNFDYYQVVPITPSDDLQRSHLAAETYRQWSMPAISPAACQRHWRPRLPAHQSNRSTTYGEWTISTIAKAEPVGADRDPVFGHIFRRQPLEAPPISVPPAGCWISLASLMVNGLSEPAELDETTWLISAQPEGSAR